MAIIPLLGFGARFQLSSNELESVAKIAKAISTVQPHLDDSKYLEYATGIYRASLEYGIDPLLLIAIAKRETSFRENLPEGAAGELGICQIRKMWVNNPAFKSEFGKVKEKDLLRPSKNFLFAAWILAELKDRIKTGTLPYWSFYNAVRFEPRLKYFVLVNKNLVDLKKEHGDEVDLSEYRQTASFKPSKIQTTKTWTPKSQPRKAKKQQLQPETSWIAAALKRLDALDKKNNQAANSVKKRHLMPTTLQAAAELDVHSLLVRSVQD